MTETFQLFGLTFHWYGLIMGLAVVTTLQLFEKLLIGTQPSKISHQCFSRLVAAMLFGALVGARLWHVITDWALYADRPWAVLFLWEGGLSIIGAAFGMGSAVWMTKRFLLTCQKLKFLVVTDALAFALPAGQALGRLGNWVNQELYGLPTNLPWKMYVDPGYRLDGYGQVAYYHPLYLYEIILWLILAIILWVLKKQTKIFSSDQYPLGSGLATAIYLAYFSVVRFGLEFLRLEKPSLAWEGISINQLLMMAVIPTAGVMIYQVWKKRKVC